jgi:hypothetical protein
MPVHYCRHYSVFNLLSSVNPLLVANYWQLTAQAALAACQFSTARIDAAECGGASDADFSSCMAFSPVLCVSHTAAAALPRPTLHSTCC